MNSSCFLEKLWIKDNLFDIDCTTDWEFNDLTVMYYVGAQCLETHINLFGIALSKKAIAYLVSSVDFVCIFAFIIGLLALYYSDKSTEDGIMRNRIDLNNFAVEVTNLPSIEIHQLKMELKNHIENMVNSKIKIEMPEETE